MAVSDALQKIASQMREGWLQNVRVILTCRLNVWDTGKNALDGFDVYRNLDFEYPTEVHRVVRKWFAANLALQSNLIDALEHPGKERIRDMVKNPLRLTLLCYSWQLHQGDLPDTKAGLYEWFVDTFYEWNKGKVPTQLSVSKREELNHALGELAKAAIDQESSRFRLRENFVNQFLGDTADDDSLFHLALQLGWLNHVGVAEENPLEKVYAFLHPTFQEYFAALAIDDWDFFLPQNHNNLHPAPIEGKKYRLLDSTWDEVFLIWLGELKEQEIRIERCVFKLLDFNDGCQNFFGYKLWPLLVRMSNEFSQLSNSRKLLFAPIGKRKSNRDTSQSIETNHRQKILLGWTWLTTPVTNMADLTTALEFFDYLGFSEEEMETRVHNDFLENPISTVFSLIEEEGEEILEFDEKSNLEDLILTLNRSQDEPERRELVVKILQSLKNRPLEVINSLLRALECGFKESIYLLDIASRLKFYFSMGFIEKLLSVAYSHEDIHVTRIIVKIIQNSSSEVSGRELIEMISKLPNFMDDPALKYILLDCAQRMSYSSFYRVWHSSFSEVRLP